MPMKFIFFKCGTQAVHLYAFDWLTPKLQLCYWFFVSAHARICTTEPAEHQNN